LVFLWSFAIIAFYGIGWILVSSVLLAIIAICSIGRILDVSFQIFGFSSDKKDLKAILDFTKLKNLKRS